MIFSPPSCSVKHDVKLQDLGSQCHRVVTAGYYDAVKTRVRGIIPRAEGHPRVTGQPLAVHLKLNYVSAYTPLLIGVILNGYLFLMVDYLH
jgi:hypothetical protein